MLAVFLPGLCHGQSLEAGKQKALAYVGCHGENGNSTLPQVPILAGQTARYIYLQLVDFKEGRRSEPQMEPFVQPLSRDDMRDLAAFFASQKPRAGNFSVDEAKARRGKSKSEEVLCTMCHLGGFAGQNEIPRVAGQNFEYMVKQLRDFKERKRTNDAGNMTAVARTLSDQDIEDLGHYLVSLQ